MVLLHGSGTTNGEFLRTALQQKQAVRIACWSCYLHILISHPVEDEPEWMLEHARQEKRQAALRRRADLEERLAKIRAKERKMRERYENGEPRFKRQVCLSKTPLQLSC